MEIASVQDSSMAFEIVDNGLSGASREIIAIGGSGTKTNFTQSKFDPYPFFLKGPVPQLVSSC
jgi:hypothetical protein